MSDLFNEEIISHNTYKMGGQNRPFCKRNRFHKPLGKTCLEGRRRRTRGAVCGRISVRRTRTFYKTMECAAGQCHYYEYPYLPGIFSAEGADADTCYGTFSCTGSSRARS